MLYCFYCLQAFLSKLLLISSYFVMLPYCWGKILVSGEDWIWFYLWLSIMVSSKFEGKKFQRVKQSTWFLLKNGTLPKSYNLHNNNCTFFSPIHTFPWRETYLFTRQIKVQIGKSTLIILFIKGKMPTLAANKQLSVHFLFQGPRIFHLSTEKSTGPIRRKWSSKWLFPWRHNEKNINKRSKIFPYREKN